MTIRDMYPIKYYSKEGFIERKLEIIDEYLQRNADFDEVEIINNRPMNIWLYAKCRKYIDPDNTDKMKH